VRDDGAREQVAAGAADAITTAVTRALGLVAHASGVARTRSDALWVALFRETYASELRPESEDRADRIVQRDPDRYARALELALARLAAAGRLAFEREGDAIVVRDAPELLGRRRRLRRSAARAIGVLQLLKTAFTFGDWMPYALWKLERHTGTRLEPTERQLRHPLLFGWPLILRVLVKRELR
jgi:hypothetical protein